jgi:hypothetical protein
MIKPDEILLVGGQYFRVLDVVPFEEDGRRSSGCYRSTPRKSSGR